MHSDKSNPPISNFLRRFTFVETMVLVVAGLGLFAMPEIFRPLWAWEIAPFSAAFLGAIYISAMIPIAQMYFMGRWSPTRVVLRAIFTFTFIVLLASLYHVATFDFSRPSVWIWFALYVALPASGGYHLWLYRSMPTDHLPAVPKRWGHILNVTAAMLALYGAGLIFRHDVFSSLFPWKLDAFHSHLYSATFLTGAVLMVSAAKIATRAEFFAVGMTEATFGGFSILGLFVVDARVQKIDWAATNTVSWVVLLGILTLLGFAMIVAAFRMEKPKA